MSGPLSKEEMERFKARYFFDDRGWLGNEPIGGYGYDTDKMFRDLEKAEADLGMALRWLRAWQEGADLGEVEGFGLKGERLAEFMQGVERKKGGVQEAAKEQTEIG